MNFRGLVGWVEPDLLEEKNACLPGWNLACLQGCFYFLIFHCAFICIVYLAPITEHIETRNNGTNNLDLIDESNSNFSIVLINITWYLGVCTNNNRYGLSEELV